MSNDLLQLAIDAGKKLKEHGYKLATAESCTGGGLAYWVTTVSGSSDWFDRGFVTYSNAAKIDMLNVSALTLDLFGEVSEPTAREMAEGALNKSNAEVSIAVTGIAGPTGGTKDKPVGMVWFGWAGKNFKTHTKVKLLDGDREEIRKKAIEVALTGLMEFI